jgi:hypothetical protein
MPRRRLEPHHRLRRLARPHRPYELLHLRVPACISRRANLLQQAHGRQPRVRRQARHDQRTVRLQLRRHRRPRRVPHRLRFQITIQLTRADQPVDRVPADVQPARDLALAKSFLQVVSEQHPLLPSDHWRLRLEWRHQSAWSDYLPLHTRKSAEAICRLSDFHPPEVSDLHPPLTIDLLIGTPQRAGKGMQGVQNANPDQLGCG